MARTKTMSLVAAVGIAMIIAAGRNLIALFAGVGALAYLLRRSGGGDEKKVYDATQKSKQSPSAEL